MKANTAIATISHIKNYVPKCALVKSVLNLLHNMYTNVTHEVLPKLQVMHQNFLFECGCM